MAPGTEARRAGSGSGHPAGDIGRRAGTVKLAPRVRAESLARQEIPSIPPAAIEPFLSRPLVVEPDGLEKAPTIVATSRPRGARGGNSASCAASARPRMRPGMSTARAYRSWIPIRTRLWATRAIYLGTAQLTRPGEPATVVLTSAVQEVEAGDKLVAAEEPQPVNYAPRTEHKIRGRVIAIYGGVAQIGEAGPQSVISINRGKADGIEVGHVLALYNRGGTVRDVTKRRGAADAQIQLPDERAGLAFVFRVFDRISYALVMQVTRPVSPLDVVQTP